MAASAKPETDFVGAIDRRAPQPGPFSHWPVFRPPACERSSQSGSIRSTLASRSASSSGAIAAADSRRNSAYPPHSASDQRGEARVNRLAFVAARTVTAPPGRDMANSATSPILQQRQPELQVGGVAYRCPIEFRHLVGTLGRPTCHLHHWEQHAMRTRGVKDGGSSRKSAARSLIQSQHSHGGYRVDPRLVSRFLRPVDPVYVAPAVGKALFPSDSPTLSVAAVYASFAVTLFMRPIGSALFGNYADRHGRRGAMITAVIGVGLVTATFGLLPTLAEIGVAAPLLFLLLRLL